MPVRLGTGRGKKLEKGKDCFWTRCDNMMRTQSSLFESTESWNAADLRWSRGRAEVSVAEGLWKYRKKKVEHYHVPVED